MLRFSEGQPPDTEWTRMIIQKWFHNNRWHEYQVRYAICDYICRDRQNVRVVQFLKQLDLACSYLEPRVAARTGDRLLYDCARMDYDFQGNATMNFGIVMSPYDCTPDELYFFGKYIKWYKAIINHFGSCQDFKQKPDIDYLLLSVVFSGLRSPTRLCYREIQVCAAVWTADEMRRALNAVLHFLKKQYKRNYCGVAMKRLLIVLRNSLRMKFSPEQCTGQNNAFT